VRYSRLLIPTVKQTPADAEVASHQLMVRAGLMRKVTSGTYTYLPLGLKMLNKVAAIIREEMNRAGAQEILMPVVQPMELWEQTRRRQDYGETLGWFTDRHGRQNVLAPTAEEVVTDLVAGLIGSYRQLPVNLYQISTKFRDEFRPRFGALRSREFLMKDAYSFDADAAGLEKTYQAMYKAYCRIFTRCGIPYMVVEAAGGPIGGSASHEFMVPTDAGEDVLLYTADGSYAANVEKAEVDPPLTQAATGEIGPPEPVDTPGVGSIDDVCEFMGTQPAEMIKTLLYRGGGKTVVGVIRGDHEINEVKLARVADVESVGLAEEATVVALTDAAVGFAGPMDLAPKVDAFCVDYAVAAMAFGVTGGNRTDTHVRNVVPGRDFPLTGGNVTVADIRNATEADTHDGKPLLSRRGIEVGHVFKLGTKYSEKLGAAFLDESGRSQPCVMGCYGIGVNRIIAAAIEAAHDDAGCIFPVTIAPFEVEVLAINADDEEVTAAAERLHDELAAAGADVLLDDRPVRAGGKFKDADLLGIPLRLAVGSKGLTDGVVELKRRTDAEPTRVAVAEAAAATLEALQELRQA